MGSNEARRLESLLGGNSPIEVEIQRNPYSVKHWLLFAGTKKDAPLVERRLVYELALKFVPRSYKLWLRYLEELEFALNERYLTSGRAEVVLRTYERCLVHLHKMPRIWLGYLGVLRGMRRGSAVRRAFDRCLRALPITQHDKVWPEFIEWATGEVGVEATAVVAYKRFVMYDPTKREAYVDYLAKIGRFGAAATELAACVNDDDFVSPTGKSKHQLWMRLCDMCAAHPAELPAALDVDAIVRSGLSRFTDEVGRLWCKLADYYIRLGAFERARDVYEEACTTVVTVRDFSMAFDAYAQFEESVLTAKMQLAEDEDDEDDEDEEENDLELRLARLERLMARRPLLLSSVLLRQNPHNVAEWHARAMLLAEDSVKAIECYSDAVKTVDPNLATHGKPHTLWIAFAAFYEDRGDVANARVIAETATEFDAKTVDDLASIYCWWAEMELRRGNHDEALKVMQRAVHQPASTQRRVEKIKGASTSVAERVHRSPKLWAFYLDLEESLGTLETARAAYDRALELRVATPQTVLNYAELLNDHEYFEDAFQAYEKGVALFKWPHVRELWAAYLGSFVERYGGSKLERARDLFEQALAKAPADDATKLYVNYAKLEERHGLARRAIAIYERAAMSAKAEHEFDAYSLYIAKVELAFGATKARAIYETAITKLRRDFDAKRMCLKFADLERRLGEIDRARAVLTHGSQFANPRSDPTYWETWREFEVAHGNEETFREMLRVKRSVETAMALSNYVADDLLKTDEPMLTDAEAMAKHAEQHGSLAYDMASASLKRKAADGGAAETQIEALERQAAKIVQAAQQSAPKAAQQDPNEIDLDDDDDDDDDEQPAAAVAAASGGDVEVAQIAVPNAVFGNVPHDRAEPAADKGAAKKPMGALARFKTSQT